MRAEAADAASHYREAFETSQDPLVSIVRELGGTVAGVRDRLSGFFTGQGNGGNTGDDVP